MSKPDVEKPKSTAVCNRAVLGHLLKLGKPRLIQKSVENNLQIPNLFFRLGVATTTQQEPQQPITDNSSPSAESSRDSGIDLCSPIASSLDLDDTWVISSDAELDSEDYTADSCQLITLDYTPECQTSIIPDNIYLETPWRSIRSRIRGSRGPRRRLFKVIAEETASPIKSCHTSSEQSMNLYMSKHCSNDVDKSALNLVRADW